MDPGKGRAEGDGSRREHAGDRIAGGHVETGAHDAGVAVEGEERDAGDRVVGGDVEEGDASSRIRVI